MCVSLSLFVVRVCVCVAEEDVSRVSLSDADQSFSNTLQTYEKGPREGERERMGDVTSTLSPTHLKTFLRSLLSLSFSISPS